MVAEGIRIAFGRFQTRAQDVVVGSLVIEGRGGGGIWPAVAGPAHCGASGTGFAGPGAAAGIAGCRLVLVLASGKEGLVPPINKNSSDYLSLCQIEVGQERA